MPKISTKIKKIGLLGGTFDPVHFGHLRIGEEILKQYALCRVEFMPARIPPHKVNQPLSPISLRLEMLRLATEGNPLFRVSEAEACREELSFLVDTLQEYRDRYPSEVSLYFIMGMDSYLEISTWHRYYELFSLSHFIITSRPGYKRPHLDDVVSPEVAASFTESKKNNGCLTHESGHKIYFQETTLLDISARMLRKKIRQGETVRYLLPEKVLDYINQNGLYLNRE